MPAPSPRRTPAPIVFAVGLFFALLGVAMLLAAGKVYLKQSEFLAHSEHAIGTVVNLDASVVENSRNRHERHNFYAPVFTFTDRAGSTRRVTSKTGDVDKPGYEIGQTIPVLYNRDQPDEAELDTFFVSWGGVAILGGMGLAVCVGGGAMAYTGLRAMRRRGGGQNPPGAGGTGGNVPRDPAILAGP